ncbi:hypothetical protein D3C81_2048500 [compost metagenome]
MVLENPASPHLSASLPALKLGLASSSAPNSTQLELSTLTVTAIKLIAVAGIGSRIIPTIIATKMAK